MDASSASDDTRAKVKIQLARYSQIVPAKPPLMRENVLVRVKATQVDIVVVANPSTDSDLKLRRTRSTISIYAYVWFAQCSTDVLACDPDEPCQLHRSQYPWPRPKHLCGHLRIAIVFQGVRVYRRTLSPPLGASRRYPSFPPRAEQGFSTLLVVIREIWRLAQTTIGKVRSWRIGVRWSGRAGRQYKESVNVHVPATVATSRDHFLSPIGSRKFRYHCQV